tara:strand:- start:3 stop:281 length:279 start_codon:yes stop_codon:yes gene_type:complete
MTVIRPNSVAGINSITAQANDLTLYTVSGASGNLNVNKLTVGSATTITTGGVNVTGVVTATSFRGDGSLLENLPASGDSAAKSSAIALFLGR